MSNYKNNKNFKNVICMTNKIYTVEDIKYIKPYGFIYLTVNKINKKMYIGKRVAYSCESSRYCWENYLGSGIILKQAIEKYGENSFDRYIIDIANSSNELSEKEIAWIKKTKADKMPFFYNISSGGDGRKDLYTKSPVYCITNKTFYSTINIASKETGDSPDLIKCRCRRIDNKERIKDIIVNGNKPKFRKGSKNEYCYFGMARYFIFKDFKKYNNAKMCLDLKNNILYNSVLDATKTNNMHKSNILTIKKYRKVKYLNKTYNHMIIRLKDYLKENEYFRLTEDVILK